jgi:hypothetical protein
VWVGGLVDRLLLLLLLRWLGGMMIAMMMICRVCGRVLRAYVGGGCVVKW